MDSLPDLQGQEWLKSWLLEGIRMVEPQAQECIENTRVQILAELSAKANDSEGPNVIWIRGGPGSGKSSISLTSKSRLQSEGRLITYFRFDRDAPTTTPVALWRRVAYDLSYRLPSVRLHLLEHLKNHTVDLVSPKAVFKDLIEIPLSKLTHPLANPTPSSLVIVIDALDECADGGLVGHLSPNRLALLQALGLWSQLPKHFKLIVTSRDADDICRALDPISASIIIPSGNSIIEGPPTDASVEALNDIHTFLEYRFQSIRTTFKLPIDWPGRGMGEEMVRRAAGIFMWATTAANFILSGDPDAQLKTIMDQASVPWSSKPLYSLYTIILKTSFEQLAENSAEAEVLRTVLGIIVVAQRPLRDEELAKLDPRVAATMIRFIRTSLSSVLDQRSTLRFVHKSFDDFLQSKECPNEYRIGTDESHHLLTRFCLTSMKNELCLNRCNLETSCLTNTDVPDIGNKVTDGIPALLSYSCCFWAVHLSLTNSDEVLAAQVEEIIMEKLLYWFEAMSLLKEMNQVSRSLLLVLKWLHHASPDEGLKDFVRDACRFVGAFIHPISQSAPHIYISALPFAPEYSLVAEHFLPRFSGTLSLSQGKPRNWPSCIFIAEHHRAAVNCVAFSSDGKFVVSGSTDKTICICDPETGSLISGPLVAEFRVSTVFFDHSGQRVWACSSYDRLCSWDIKTGEKRSDFQAWRVIGSRSSDDGRNIVSISWQGTVTAWNTDTSERHDLLKIPANQGIYKISLSPDGRYIACAEFGAKSIRIWNLVDGSEVRGPSPPRFEHEKAISAISFSADSAFVVSGSEDGTVLVWDAATSVTAGSPLATSGVQVDAVAYSHKVKIVVLASGCPGIVVAWNISTRKEVIGPLKGHTSWVTAITLSLDGGRVLTASYDGTVRMWDLRSWRKPVTDVNEGHVDNLRCVTLSPCGRKLASLDSERTIRVWNADTGELDKLISTVSSYNNVIFSSDSSQLVTFGSDHRTPLVWNTDTGEPAFRWDLRTSNNAGSAASIEHLCFRSTDKRLITCSNYGIVRIWSLGSGVPKPVSRPHTVDARKHVKIIALSPDGLTAIVRDEERKLRHYIWSTTKYQPLPFTLADQEFLENQLVYSPNGRYLAATTREYDALRVWDTQNGQVVADHIKRNDKIGCIAFSPDDRHIALSSDRTSIWIYEAHIDRPASGPWKGHTGEITTLAFSQDGKKLVSGSYDGQIRIWDTTSMRGEPPGFLGVGTQIRDGWVMDVNENKLFWVPKDHRERLLWPGNKALIGGTGITTKLNVSKVKYGKPWVECSEDGK